MTTLSFHGAARSVTGSCFFLEQRGTRIVHGDPERGMSALATALEERGHAVTLPRRNERIELD